MLINNVDIANYGAKLLKKSIDIPELKSSVEYLRSGNKPIKLFQKFQAKKITIEVYITGSNIQNVMEKMSSLSRQLMECTIKFKDMDFYYDAILTNAKYEKSVRKDKVRVIYEFISGYGYKPMITVTANRIYSKTVVVDGNIETPAIIEITPSANIIDMTITGFGSIFTMKNLTAGQKIIIDGEDRIVTQNGINKFADFEAFEFPKLQTGSNTLAFSKNTCDITIKYKPKSI
ncbi:phage distal tail protein [Clostridium cellulovorans]|uniref:Tail component family protein n=1 Tax=Clostridium cellulovorans (strain ATCC 35296 / DSM 3052 / OCM 3 / 743B) TaxID=573061 RepID=D9SSG6_CLOC7|nr:phage tail domain-containing protein [Clostridium cellulovorans]ADL50563.1 tail component family protein [Clostridium cellulovorans 743B]